MLDQENLDKVAKAAAQAADRAVPRAPSRGGSIANADNGGMAIATGDHSPVTIGADTVGQLLERARPWWYRWLLVFGVLACSLPLLRIWQALQFSSWRLFDASAWLTAHDPLFLPKAVAVAALAATLWVYFLWAWRSSRRRR